MVTFHLDVSSCSASQSSSSSIVSPMTPNNGFQVVELLCVKHFHLTPKGYITDVHTPETLGSPGSLPATVTSRSTDSSANPGLWRSQTATNMRITGGGATKEPCAKHGRNQEGQKDSMLTSSTCSSRAGDVTRARAECTATQGPPVGRRPQGNTQPSLPADSRLCAGVRPKQVQQ